MKHNQRGFTLAELLLVIVILILLLMAALIAIRTQIIKGNDMKRKTDLSKIQKVVEEYYNDYKQYPLAPPNSPVQNCGSGDLKPYLERVPCDPVKKSPYFFISNIAGILTPTSGYILCAVLENRSDPDIARIGCHPVVGCGWSPGFNYCVSAGVPPVEPNFDPNAYDPNGNSLTPTPTPPWISIDPWACTPAGDCNRYGNPVGDGCPFVYTSGCMYSGAFQCSNSANRCQH